MAQQKRHNYNNWKSPNQRKYQAKQWKKKEENEAKSSSTPSKKEKSFAFSYSVVKGDLFTCPESSSLCHCISRDLGMGKGIALIFKKKFGGVNALRQQRVSVGECGILLRQNRYVYYLITKERYFHKPSYETVAQSLEYMRNHAVFNNVKRISMPKIGCGLDRLQWNRVEGIIKNVFKNTDIEITVYEL